MAPVFSQQSLFEYGFSARAAAPPTPQTCPPPEPFTHRQQVLLACQEAKRVHTRAFFDAMELEGMVNHYQYLLDQVNAHEEALLPAATAAQDADQKLRDRRTDTKDQIIVAQFNELIDRGTPDRPINVDQLSNAASPILLD